MWEFVTVFIDRISYVQPKHDPNLADLNQKNVLTYKNVKHKISTNLQKIYKVTFIHELNMCKVVFNMRCKVECHIKTAAEEAATESWERVQGAEKREMKPERGWH